MAEVESGHYVFPSDHKTYRQGAFVDIAHYSFLLRLHGNEITQASTQFSPQHTQVLACLDMNTNIVSLAKIGSQSASGPLMS